VAEGAASDRPHPGATVTLDRMARADAYNAWLLERARPFLGRDVLDAGAGVGTFTSLLAREGRSVTALEPDPDYVERLRARFAENAAVTVLEGDATTVELDAGFDSIVCFNVLEHIRDDAAAVERFRTMLRPGGRLLLLVPAHPSLFGAIDEVVGHERRYTTGGLRRLLEGAGFAPEVVRYVNPVGAVGWLVASRIAKTDAVPSGPLRLYDRFVPVLRLLDRARLPFGLSVWAVARRD
jgi:SAM-dependent methyltransferase